MMTSTQDERRLLKDFQALSQEVEFLVRDFFSETPCMATCPAQGFLPSVDVFETEREVVYLLELAGVAPQDLSVRVEAGMLVVSGKRREIPGFARRYYHKMELDFGNFERSVSVPQPVDTDSLRIENLGGIYQIRLRKVNPGLNKQAVAL